MSRCNYCHDILSFRQEIDTSTSEERALTEDEVKRITINQKSFIDLLQPEVIVAKLRELDVITARHRDAVLCKENDAEKNRKLLEIIKRRSYRDVINFCGVLEEQRMEFLAKAVKGEGGRIFSLVVYISTLPIGSV